MRIINVLLYTLLFCFVTAEFVSAQNSDLLLRNHSGAYSAMGGTGIAANNTNSSFDLNPALLNNYTSFNLSLSQSVKFYNYSLLRMSSLVGAQTFNWDKAKLRFENGTVIYRVNSAFCVGAGIFLKVDPQLVNKKIAVTFSDLFAQETSGTVYAAAIGFGYKLSGSLSAGISFYSYTGSINSYIVGDNHGNDADKWIKLESKLRGFNLKGGLLYKGKEFNLGLTIESPFSMNLDADKTISSIPLFSYLLPKYESTKWNQPLVFGIGASYYGIEDWYFEADFETRRYKDSNIQLNLYEFGSPPAWETVNIIRIGVEYKTGSNLGLPIRAGYAVTPQLYYSSNSTGRGNTVTDFTNTERNIKHIITAGTTIKKNNISINLSFIYSILSWNRVMIVPQTITDEYKEKTFTISAEILYSL